MAPFPQKWIPAKDGGACANGIAAYQCEFHLAFGGILNVVFSPEEVDTLTLASFFNKAAEFNLMGPILSAGSGFMPTLYTGYYNELISLDGLTCSYMANSTLVFAGDEERDEERDEDRPSAPTLHDGRTMLETECQTRQSDPGGKDYGGNLNVTYSGKACVPWKDLDFFDMDFSYIEGNSCRSDTHGHARWYFSDDSCSRVKATDNFPSVTHRDVPLRRNPGIDLGVYCFVELDATAREVGDEDSIKAPPRYIRGDLRRA